MDLLSLLHIGIVLGDPLQGQLIHQVDGVGGAEVAVLRREGGREGRKEGGGMKVGW